MRGNEGARQFHEYLSVLARRRWAVYLGIAVVALFSLVGSFLVTPLYRSTVTVQIERQNPNILTFKDLGNVDYSFAAYSDFYQTQYKILQSDAVAMRAVERAKLLSNPSFESGSRPSLRARLRSLIPSPKPKTTMSPEERAASRLLSTLEVAPERNSHLVRISWVSSDPELAAKVANAVADAYIAFNIESNFTASDQASEFLVNQIGTLKNEIAAIESQLQDYGESKRIVSVDDASNITLKALSDVAQRRTEAQTVLAQKEAAWRAATSTPAEALPEVLKSDLIARLKQENAALEAEYAEKSETFKDDWPGMVSLREKLRQTGERLAKETESISSSVKLSAEADYRKARSEVENLSALLARQQDAAQTLKRDAVEFTNLQTEAQKKRETLNALIARQNEMALSTRLKELDATSSNVKIVDPARPPLAPFRPNKLLNLVLGLLLGAGLGVACAFFLDYLDSTVHSPDEIEKLSGLPLLATIPRQGEAVPVVAIRRRPAPVPGDGVDLVAHRDRRAAISEAYRELRTGILLSRGGSPPRRILVTSALPEEGKSATAINLAVVLAQLGRKVALVDTDLRRPRLHKAFGLDNARGMSSFLSGLEDDAVSLARASAVENLVVVPSGPIPPNPSELLEGGRFDDAARAFLDRGYDHVLFDSPPTLSVSDAVILGHHVDAAVVVVRAHRTPRESIRAAVDKFRQSGVTPIGIVLNDLDAAGLGYRYHRYYGRYESVESDRADAV